MSKSVEVELRNTFDNGRCVVCGDKLENDCLIYGTLRGQVERPEYYSIKDIYGENTIKVSEFDGEDEDQRIASFSNHDVKTYCSACFDHIEDLIDSASSQIKENKRFW